MLLTFCRCVLETGFESSQRKFVNAQRQSGPTRSGYLKELPSTLDSLLAESKNYFAAACYNFALDAFGKPHAPRAFK